MPKHFPEEKREEWKRLVQEWESINSKTSIARWCQDKNINYNTFLYWKERFCTKPTNRIDRSSFQELTQPAVSTDITLEYQQIRIQLPPNFDPAVLIKCLRAVKEAVC